MGTVAGVPDTQQASEQKSLYDRDFYTWARQQVDSLKRRDFATIDWENVIEEVEGLVRSEERRLKSQYARVMEHFLKLQYRRLGDNQYLAGWSNSVEGARSEIHKVLQENPGLKSKRDEVFSRAWVDSRRDTINAFVHYSTERIQDDAILFRERKRLTREWSQVLPQHNPYTRHQVEGSDWMPERIRLAQRPQSRHQPSPKLDWSR